MLEDKRISRRSFLKYTCIACAGVVGSGLLAGCAGGASSGSASSAASSASTASGSAASSDASSESPAAPKLGKSIVVFFSHTGENPGVGYIEEGNTSIVAHMISGKVVSDVFEIVPAQPYPEGYDECCEVAFQELKDNARPELATQVENFADYDTVYLGYPIWCEDLPMIVYSFVESQDWTGKKVAPFCTYDGSGLGNTVSTLQSLCVGATVTEGLGIKGVVAQNDRSEADSAVNAWLAKVR